MSDLISVLSGGQKRRTMCSYENLPPYARFIGAWKEVLCFAVLEFFDGGGHSSNQWAVG